MSTSRINLILRRFLKIWAHFRPRVTIGGPVPETGLCGAPRFRAPAVPWLNPQSNCQIPCAVNTPANRSGLDPSVSPSVEFHTLRKTQKHIHESGSDRRADAGCGGSEAAPDETQEADTQSGFVTVTPPLWRQNHAAHDFVDSSRR
jgi:hypothetical protein